jgi:hypothetical protein
MDIYLPADFHILRDDAVTDWRDAPAPPPSADARLAPPQTQRIVAERCVDPSWLAI